MSDPTDDVAVAPNLADLRSLYSASPAATAFFDNLENLNSGDDGKELSVERMLDLLLSNNVPAARKDVITVMQRLHDFRLGKFLIGRHGRPSRIQWATSPGNIARAARGGTNDITPGLIAAPAGKQNEPQIRGAIREFSFPLRRDFSIDFKMPLDLTAVEAERFNAFVRTLPLPSGPENSAETGSK